jgi:mRNA-degrading endonuclease RelE of RelBE toxin-antitoxin system
MSYEVILTPDFKKFFKKLFKKYPSLKEDLLSVIEKLERNHEEGISIGGNLYKVRLAISSKNKGKSGGARVIYYFFTQNKEVYLIHIFDKSDFDKVPKAKLLELLESAGLS